MKRVLVTAADGTQWKVRVAWEPRWRVLARRFGGWRRQRKKHDVTAGDVADGVLTVGELRPGSGRGGGAGFDLDDAISVVALIVLVLSAVATLFWWILLPLLLLAVDIVIVVILLVVAIVARVLFGRPWTVEATAVNGQRFTVDVIGWRAALRRREEIAELLRQGRQPIDIASPGPLMDRKG